MLRSVSVFLRLALLSLGLMLFLPPLPAFAGHPLTSDSTVQQAPPPLRVRAPQLLPSFTNSSAYHQEVTFPTTTAKWIDVDLSEQRVVASSGCNTFTKGMPFTAPTGTTTSASP